MCTECVKKRHPWPLALAKWIGFNPRPPQLHWIMQWPHSCQYTLGKWWWNLAPVVSNTKATRSLNYGLKDTAHGEKQATKNAKHVSWVGDFFSTLASTITIYYWDVTCRLSRKEPRNMSLWQLKKQTCFLFRPWNWAKRSVKSHISTELMSQVTGEAPSTVLAAAAWKVRGGTCWEHGPQVGHLRQRWWWNQSTNFGVS